jgi:nitrate/nitrite transporter NarK
MITRSPTHITISFFRGWMVVFAATAMGLMLGILYSWSVVKSGIPDSWGWSNTDKALPYSVMCIMFSLVMVPAGRLQDRFGPRWVVFLGGLLAGLGCIVAGLGGSSRLAYVIGFGVLTGTGVGFAYSALTPSAIKWFPPRHTGLVVGVVVAGNALAPVFLAPFSTWLLRRFAVTTPAGLVELGVSATMIVLGAMIWLVIGALFWFVANPPVGFVASVGPQGMISKSTYDANWKQMLRSSHFWLLYVMYFVGTAAGLTFISVAADLGKRTLGERAFWVVVILALGNTAGRILAGVVSDRIGRHITLFLEFMFQAVMIGVLYWLSKHGGGTWPVVLMVVFFIGLNYGANLSIFPSACKDYFGIRYFGLNYGCLFTAFGAAGLVMPVVNGIIIDMTGNPDLTYILMMSMMVAAALVALASHRLVSK